MLNNNKEDFPKNKCTVFPTDLITAINFVYNPAHLNVSNIICEAESSDYGAYRFLINGCHVVYRIAKTTPTKIGQFVTLWKRSAPLNKIAPIDTQDSVDFIVINVSDKINSGQFIFNKNLLVSKGIMSSHGKGGKRAIRVYPPWAKPVANDAIKTQQWQVPYFCSIAPDGSTDSARIRKLFGL